MTFIVPSTPSARDAKSVGVRSAVSAVVGVAVEETSDYVQREEDGKAVKKVKVKGMFIVEGALS